MCLPFLIHLTEIHSYASLARTSQLISSCKPAFCPWVRFSQNQGFEGGSFPPLLATRLHLTLRLWGAECRLNDELWRGLLFQAFSFEDLLPR